MGYRSRSQILNKKGHHRLKNFSYKYDIQYIPSPTSIQKKEFKRIKKLQNSPTPLLDVALFTTYIDKNVFSVDFSEDSRNKLIILDRWYLSTLAYQFTNPAMKKLTAMKQEFARTYVESRIDSFIQYVNNINNRCSKCITLVYKSPIDWDEHAENLGKDDPNVEYLKEVDKAYKSVLEILAFVDYPELNIINLGGHDE